MTKAQDLESHLILKWFDTLTTINGWISVINPTFIILKVWNTEFGFWGVEQLEEVLRKLSRDSENKVRNL